jgi:hypothetical protein
MTVLEAVKQSKIPYFMIKGAIKAAEKMIPKSESIFLAQPISLYNKPITGALPTNLNDLSGTLFGVLVITGQRLLFVASSLGIRTTKEMRLSDIRSIDSKNSLVTECLRISGVSNTMVFLAKPDDIIALRNAINEALEKRNAPQSAAAPADDELSISDVEQLQALKQLYDTGVITDEEFAAKKAQILNL